MAKELTDVDLAVEQANLLGGQALIRRDYLSAAQHFQIGAAAASDPEQKKALEELAKNAQLDASLQLSRDTMQRSLDVLKLF